MKRWLAFIILFSAGCGSGRVPTYPVTGKVLWDKTPAAGATVVFHPAKALPEGVGKPRATVQADGTFKLGTYDGADGAPEGDYKVTVEWWLSPGGDEPATSRLHPRYGKPEESGISQKVGKEPTQVSDIVLKP